MHRSIRVASAAALMFVSALVVGCAGGVAPAGPGVLQGTVRSQDGSAAAGVRAALVGSRVFAATDAAGQFSLSGVPEGSATLQLDAPGLSARIAIPRVGTDLTVKVSVRLSHDGKTAELESEPEAKLTGTIDSIAAPDLVVAGKTVHTDGATRIEVRGQAAKLADLAKGEQVEVEGALQADGSILARELKAEAESEGNGNGHGNDGGNGDGNGDGNGNGGGTDGGNGSGDQHDTEVELNGTIGAVDAAGFALAGKTIHTGAATRIELNGAAATAADLKEGQTAEVKGALQADGSVLATRVEASSAQVSPPPAPENEAELKGAVEALAGTDLTVAGKLVHTTAQTLVDGHGARSLADVKVGALVEVHGALQADGSTLAARIHLED